jgi:TonB dependent receptor/CarboxypepD_reg-like domain/TonB-dependent Receptor Plug Domain
MKVNIKTILLPVICCLLFCNKSFAQEGIASNGIITGIVLDEQTQAPMPGTSVIVKGANKGAITDANGSFTISKLPAGTYTLIISFNGYSKKNIDSVVITGNMVTDMGTLKLTEQSITLSNVTVSPGSFSIMGNERLSRQSLTSKDIKNMSWAEDITRAVSRLPGVSSNDFSSKFNVRGGEADEVLMTLDGMELYDAFHQRDIGGGLFSIVDIETIQGVDLLTGGFPAEFGNRQSAVFNMRTKRIANGQRHTSLGFSIMNARLYTDGTFAKNKGSYLFSARRGMLDLFYRLTNPTENIPSYSDMMAKAEYKLNLKHTLSFHILRADDKTRRDDVSKNSYDSSDIKYANTYSWLTLKSNYIPELFSRTILFAGFNAENRNGSFRKNENDLGIFLLKDKRRFHFFGLKQDWNWEASDRFILKGGFDIRLLKVDYNYFYSIEETRVTTNDSLIRYKGLVDVKSSPSAQQANAYISARFQLLPSLFMETGLRYDYASHTKDKVWSPRVSLAYAFSTNTFLRAAWGYYYQSQLINNLDVNHNATTFNPAELSKHYVVGFEHLFKNQISLRVEAYYKDIPKVNPVFENLRDPLEVFPEARDDVVKLNINRRTAKGIELFLKYDIGKKISWWFSYALAKSDDDIRSIDFSGLLTSRTGKVPRTTNQVHTIYADLNYRPNKKWHFSLSEQFYTGWRRTNYHYNTQILTGGKLIFYPAHELYNGTAYPAYHRMDLRINRHFQLKKGNISAFVHIINLYNHKNLRKFDLDTRDSNGNLVPDGNGGYLTPRNDVYWFGFTPILGVSWEL